MGSERCFYAKNFLGGFGWLVSGVATPKFRGIPNYGGGPNFVGTHYSQ